MSDARQAVRGLLHGVLAGLVYGVLLGLGASVLTLTDGDGVRDALGGLLLVGGIACGVAVVAGGPLGCLVAAVALSLRHRVHPRTGAPALTAAVWLVPWTMMGGLTSPVDRIDLLFVLAPLAVSATAAWQWGRGVPEG